MAKLKFTGPEGFAVVGVGELEPGKTVEVDDAVALGLEGHQWFEVSGVSKKARDAAEAEQAEVEQLTEEEPDESD